MCYFCKTTISTKGTHYGKIINLKKTASDTDMKDCQIIIHKDQKPALVIFDRFGRAAFIEISNCPMCGRNLTEEQPMFEVIYISPSCKQSVNFIYDLVEKIKQNGISNFEVDMKRLQIKSDKFIVSAVYIEGGNLRISHHMTEYYIDKVSGVDYSSKRIQEKAQERLKDLKCSFREGTKEISEEELIEILKEAE